MFWISAEAGETAGILPVAVGGGDLCAAARGARFLIFAARKGSEHWARLGTSDVKEESLGNRRLGGVNTTGRRATITIPSAKLATIDLLRCSTSDGSRRSYSS